MKSTADVLEGILGFLHETEVDAKLFYDREYFLTKDPERAALVYHEHITRKMRQLQGRVASQYESYKKRI